MIYSLPQPSVKKDYVLNILGSVSSSGVSLLFLIIVSRILGDESAGLFSLGYSTAQMMACIGTFELRNVQITDVKRQFEFSDYLAFRILSAALMILTSLLFIVLRQYQGYKALVIGLLCIYMTLTVFCDLSQSTLHLNGFLFLCGASQSIQPIISLISFTLSIIITQNLIYSILIMIGFTALCILFFDMPFIRNFYSFKPVFRFGQLKQLFFLALPLFFSTFLTQYTFNAPKYAIDTYLTAIDQSHYGYLVMPAFVINLLGLFIFRPQIVPLSEKWQNKDYSGFKKTICILFACILTTTIIVLPGGYFLGIPVLNIVYSTNLNAYTTQLLILLIGGGFNAAGTLTITLLTVMRKQRYSVVAYLSAFLLSLFIPNLLVKSYGINGAVASYLLEMMVIFLFLMLIFVICFMKAQREKALSPLE